MFEAISLYQMFSPIHPEWLHRSDAKGLDVSAADLDSIEENFPNPGEDPLFAEYRMRQATGKLHKRRGRKPITPAGYLRLWYARFTIDNRMAEIWSKRQAGVSQRREFEKAPVQQAAEEVARSLNYGSGQSLLNLLSRHGVSNKQ